MLKIIKLFFALNKAEKKKENPIAKRIEIKEMPAKTWWS